MSASIQYYPQILNEKVKQKVEKIINVKQPGPFEYTVVQKESVPSNVWRPKSGKTPSTIDDRKMYLLPSSRSMIGKEIHNDIHK